MRKGEHLDVLFVGFGLVNMNRKEEALYMHKSNIKIMPVPVQKGYPNASLLHAFKAI